MMHLSRCLAAGGFKINGPPRIGKGPMPNEEGLKSSNEASLLQPTQVGRIETCTELIRQVTKCLENNDKQCAMRLIGELIRLGCHDGRLVGGEIANSVRDAFHELWLISDNKTRCEILSLLKNLGVSRRWLGDASGSGGKIGNWLKKCGIEIERRTTKSKIIKDIESLMRELGWSREIMCKEVLRLIGIKVDEIEEHGVNVCDWITNINEAYFVGLVMSDIADRVVRGKKREYVKVSLHTTDGVSAVLFLIILLHFSQTGNVGISFNWDDTPERRDVKDIVAVEFYVYVRREKWRWLNIEEIIKYIKTLDPEDIVRVIAGEVDGDGEVYFHFANSEPRIKISACKKCTKRIFLDIIQEALLKLGIMSRIYELKTAAELEVYGEDAIKLLRLLAPHLHHPVKRIRAMLMLMHHDGKINYNTFKELYESEYYELKRGRALEFLARAAPQTHTHGEQNTNTRKKDIKNQEK
jgi:hypothetical protein